METPISRPTAPVRGVPGLFHLISARALTGCHVSRGKVTIRRAPDSLYLLARAYVNRCRCKRDERDQQRVFDHILTLLIEEERPKFVLVVGSFSFPSKIGGSRGQDCCNGICY